LGKYVATAFNCGGVGGKTLLTFFANGPSAVGVAVTPTNGDVISAMASVRSGQKVGVKI
jgi:hypothetical protein